jgi:predicted nucleotidyltransferase
VNNGLVADITIHMELSRFWKTDASGYLLNDVRPMDSSIELKQVTELLKERLKSGNSQIHSAYVTGSVARGLYKHGQSDLDLFFVLPSGISHYSDLEADVRNLESDLAKGFPLFSDVQIELWPWNYVFPIKNIFSIGSFVIKTHSLCFFGEDLSKKISPFKLSGNIPNDDIVQIKADIEEALQEIENNINPANVKYWGRRIAKNIVRTAFGIVCLKEGKFTRDIELCAGVFSKYFPEKTREIDIASKLIRSPTADPLQLKEFLEGFGPWLINQANLWLSENNPEKYEAMLLG